MNQTYAQKADSLRTVATARMERYAENMTERQADRANRRIAELINNFEDGTGVATEADIRKAITKAYPAKKKNKSLPTQ